jgi:Rieske Fe-S protein
MAERRGVVKLLGGVLLVSLGGALTVPAAVFYTGPARRRRESDPLLDVAAIDRLPEGVPVRVAVVAKRRLDAWTAFTDVTLGAAWLQRSGDSVRALSTVCPHAGCSIDWDAPQKCFACPCHGSVFAPDGARTEGPSPRGMDALDVEVKAGRVLVAYKRFRQGVSDREPT